MKVKFLGWISSLAGKREMDIDIDESVQLKDILPFSLQEKNVIVVINDKAGSEESTVKDTDRVVLLPVISGG
jgi:molybdopterin converting factor small subunit